MDGTKARDVTEIIELSYLQELQDALGKVVHITTAVLNTQGVPVTAPTNLHAFCELMQASNTGIQMCMRTNSQLIEESKATRRPAVVTCPNSGLKTAAVPIFLGDEFLGCWLIGQMRTNTIDAQLIERTAMEAGLSFDEAKLNMEKLPEMSEEDFQGILTFLDVFIKEITQLVEVNYQLENKNTELVRLTDQLNILASTFEDFIDLCEVGAYVIDAETGDLLIVNNLYATQLGKSAAEMVGQKCWAQMGGDTWCDFCPRATLRSNKDSTEPMIWENYFAEMNIWLRITSRAIRWVDGRDAIMVTFTDITEQKHQEEEMAYIAYYDQRLKIPNGIRLFLDVSTRGAEGDQDLHGLPSHMICFDIQALRKINDAYGRETGDQLLMAIRDWITAEEGLHRPLYRVDGDEFAILCLGMSEAQAMELAHHIWNRFEQPWSVTLGEVTRKIFVSVYLGVIPCSGHFENHAEFINVVERVLETARDVNGPLKYDEKVAQAFRDHLQLEISLKNSVLNGMEGFSVFYQPIVDPVSGSWRGMEALCRWESPELGPVSPVVFIPEAEQLGLIAILGEWVLEQSIMQMKHWEMDKREFFVLDVNLSPLELGDQDLPTRVIRLLEKYNYPPEKLSLEITESAEMQFDDYTMACLNQLREAGITLSLDDFGTGYAGFSNLNQLPVAILKTDRSFLSRIETDQFLQHTMRIMVEFAHAAGMQVIAEGVETPGQQEILIACGVDYLQGFLFAKPMPPSECEKHLTKS